MEAFKETFLEESQELLENLEGYLLTLEQNPTDLETLAAVFRVIHTIKGSSGMFCFLDISNFLHNLEDTLEPLRDGGTPIKPELVTLILLARDYLFTLLAVSSPTEQQVKQVEALLEEFRKYFANDTNPADDSTQSSVVWGQDTEEKHAYHIMFRPSLHTFLNGTNPILLIDALRDLSTFTTMRILTDTLPSLEQYNPELCYLGWEIDLETCQSLEDIKDVFAFLDEESICQIDPVLQQDPTAQDETLAPKELPANTDITQTVRVASDKLDLLVDIVGELVGFNAHLRQIAQESHDIPLVSLTEHAERMILKMRDITMSMRMLPVASIFGRFQRFVRDTAAHLNKDVVLLTDGGETELDKTVLDRLFDPLMHLVRNALDHGIEDQETRIQQGKPATGRILLSAMHSGAYVYISVVDDGAGINPQKVVDQAIRKGILPPPKRLKT